MPVAFVLSGGASLGAAQAGMVHALYERGVEPDMLIGTSVGAINASFLASRPPTVQTARRLEQIWRSLRRGNVFPASPLSAGLGLLGVRDHSVPMGPLRRLVRSHVEIDGLEDAPIGLHVVAVDALSGEEVLLSDGPAVDAVLASAAVPGVFPPVLWGDRMLVDGGVLNNTPVSHAVALGADRIIVLPAIESERLGWVSRGAVGAAVGAISRAINQRLVEDLVRYADAAELIVLPAPDGGILPMDFGHAEDLISDGLERARGALARRPQAPALRLAA